MITKPLTVAALALCLMIGTISRANAAEQSSPSSNLPMQQLPPLLQQLAEADVVKICPPGASGMTVVPDVFATHHSLPNNA
jgi:hypothetical protein